MIKGKPMLRRVLLFVALYIFYLVAESVGAAGLHDALGAAILLVLLVPVIVLAEIPPKTVKDKFLTWSTLAVFGISVYGGLVDYSEPHLSPTASFFVSFGLLGLGFTFFQTVAYQFIWIIMEITGRTKPAPPPMPTILPTDSKAGSVVHQGRLYIDRINALIPALPAADHAVAAQIKKLVQSAVQIINYIEKNPHLYPITGTFIAYYFPTAIKLLESYVEFQNKTVKVDNVKELIKEISDSLDTISDAFEAQLNSLYTDKVLDLKLDMKVLQDIMEKEGHDS